MSELAETVVRTLSQRTLSLATAESLTGGLIGATITDVPGASKVYLGGIVAYASNMKHVLLDVPDEEIVSHTVVSEEVALSMAIGLQNITHADYVVAVTGVAGPEPQAGHAPGEVWIAVLGPRVASFPQFQQAERFEFEGDREAVRRETVEQSFRMLLRVVSPVG